MNKYLKWLIIVVPFILVLIFITIALLLSNKEEEVKIINKEFVTKDGRVTFSADAKYVSSDKGEYDLYLNKDKKQIVGIFTYNLSEYEEKTDKEILDKQVGGFIESRKNTTLLKKESTIEMDDKKITKIEYSGKTDKSSECVYIFSVITFTNDPNYVIYVNEVILKSNYEKNISEMISILKSAKLN